MDTKIQEINRCLRLLFQHGDTIELRCVGDRTIGGYYRNSAKLAEDAAMLNSSRFNPPQNVYVGLNPIDPQLYARQADQFGYAKKGTGVKDQEVACRRWLLIDVDPVRPSGVSATDRQKHAAIELATEIYAWLQEQIGTSCTVCADSGNGAHMLIRLPDLPNSVEVAWYCDRFLQLLADRFSGDAAKVDTTTSNAARICTLYGTFKRKGSDIPGQPHRLSRLVLVPDPLQPVSWQRMTAAVAPYPGDQQLVLPNSESAGWEIEALLQDHELEYTRDDDYRSASGELATRFELEVCPFVAEHNDRSAFIIQWHSGAICFGCHHDSCNGRDWYSLKQLWGLPSSVGITAADIILPPPVVQQPELLIVRSLDIQPEQVGWLWHDRLVIGGINLCCGRGGIGKTYFLCDLVARITNASLPAPNGQPLRHGRVLYSTGEDHVSKILEPRMQAHEVDRSCLEYVKGLPAGKYVELLDVLRHADLLREAIRQRPDTVALVLDPISSFQGGADTNKVSQVRRFTAVLTQISEEFDIAILGIHHFNKGKRDVAGDSISGSHAYRDAARSIWLFALDAKEPTRRLMVCDKHNWAEQRPMGLAYRIEQGRIVYEDEPLDLSADELMSQGTAQSLDIACSWLLAQLSTGPQPAIDIQAAASVTGISDRTLNRAKKQLGVITRREKDHWTWTLASEP